MYKKGDVVPIFLDWQTNERQLGIGELVHKVRNGYNFIIEDSWELEDLELMRIPESLTPNYSFERWKVKFINLTPLGQTHIKLNENREHNIRYLKSLGILKSNVPKEEDREPYIRDKFLEIDGVEIF